MSRYHEDDTGCIELNELGYLDDSNPRHRFESEARFNAEADAADLERIRKQREDRTIKDSLQVGGDE
jgi:hypothetical protein